MFSELGDIFESDVFGLWRADGHLHTREQTTFLHVKMNVYICFGRISAVIFSGSDSFPVAQVRLSACSNFAQCLERLINVCDSVAAPSHEYFAQHVLRFIAFQAIRSASMNAATA